MNEKHLVLHPLALWTQCTVPGRLAGAVQDANGNVTALVEQGPAFEQVVVAGVGYLGIPSSGRCVTVLCVNSIPVGVWAWPF